MNGFQSIRFVKACLFTFICVFGGALSFVLLPSAHAAQPCLRIALPEAAIGEVGGDIYRAAMQDAGLCVHPVLMPPARAFMAMRYNQIDGVFAMLEEFAKLVGTPVVRGNVLLGNPDGILVVKKEGPKSLADLNSEEIGVWLGAGWSEMLLENYEHAVPVPGGPAMMMEMLVKGRIEGILLNAYSLGIQGGAPAGFVEIPVAKLTVYSFLRAEHAEHMSKFDDGTARYRKKIAVWRENRS